MKAVTWLASGNVTVAGTLDLSGATPATLDTSQNAQLASNRILPEPGPGGYTGGLGARGGLAPETGAGPGGGPAGVVQISSYPSCFGGSASYLSTGPTYNNGATSLTGSPYGSYLLVPLYGGSGGGGGLGSAAGLTGGIGGAGAGAIRIASSTQISVTGQIVAVGGNGGSVTGPSAGCPGGPGSGGAIHLIAPTLLGNGGLVVRSGYILGSVSSKNGIVRLSTTTNNFTGYAPGYIPGPLYLPPPTPLWPPLASASPP